MEKERKVLPRINDCGEYFLRGGGSIYDSTVFKEFFEKNDLKVMGWAENVYEKLEGTGILPSFLKRENNEDFRSLWITVTQMFAFIVLYARKYNEIDTNKILFEAFIDNRGLVTDLVDSQEQMEYLFNNYLEEYAKRGRLDIIGTEGEILGEFLRLIQYSSKDEFIFALLQPENTGWCIGQSSPTWQKTGLVTNVTKAYEFTESIVDINKYPLLSSSFIYPVEDATGSGQIIEGITFTGQQSVGIDGTADTSKLVVVDPNLSYELSFFLKKSADTPSLLRFGVVPYDKDKNPLPGMQVLQNGGWEIDTQDGLLDWTSRWAVPQTVPAGWVTNRTSTSFKMTRLGDNNVAFLQADSLPSQTEFDFWVEVEGDIGDGQIISFTEAGTSSNNYKITEPGTHHIQLTLGNATSAYWVYYPVEIRGSVTVRNVSKKYVTDFHTSPTLDLTTDNVYYYIRGIALSNNEKHFNAPPLDFLTGRALSFPPEVRYIALQIIQDRTSVDDGYVYIYDIKIKPLILPFQQGYMGEKNIIATWYKNNSYQSKSVLDTYTKNYLLSYKNVLGTEIIPFYEGEVTYTVVFKIFSNKYIYLQDASIQIFGSTYMTDVNGECVIELPQGEFVYTVTAREEQFAPYNSVIMVSEDTVQYVQMQGDSFQWTVTFQVTGVDNAPLAGATITMNNQTQLTSARGIAFFSVFKGDYSYKVEMEGYYDYEKNVTITADIMESVQMEEVPYKNVSFRVRDGVQPVDGATIVVNVEGTDQTGTTNSTGIATGFVMKPGTYTYQISKSGYVTQRAQFTIQDNALVDVNIQKVPKYDVTFNVVYNDLPFENTFVTLNSVTLTTNKQGQVTFQEINGTYSYQIFKDDFIDQTGQITVNGAAVTKNINILAKQYNLSFHVVSGLVPVENASILVGTETKVTDAQGNAVFVRPSATYNWTVNATGMYRKQGFTTVNKRDTDVTVDMMFITYNATFTVRTNGIPVRGASVILDGQELVTNSAGQVIFNKKVGTYHYTAALEGYTSEEGDIIITDADVTQNVELALITGALSFKVFDEDGVTPLASASVTVNSDTKNTDSSGIAGTWNLPPKQYNYAVTKAGYDTKSGVVTLSKEGMQAEVVMKKTVAPTYNLIFNVFSTGTAIANAEIYIGAELEAITNESGQATITRPAGTYTYKIVAPYFADYTNTITVSSTQQINVNLTRLTSDVTFDVKDVDTSDPVQDVLIAFNNEVQYTDAAGHAVFNAIPQGQSLTYVCTKKPPYKDSIGTVAINQPTITATVLMGELTYTIFFSVLTVSGAPMKGVTCQIGSFSQVTGDDGTASIEGVKNGVYGYKAFIDGYEPSTGEVTIFNDNAYLNLNMIELKASVLVTVTNVLSQPVSGVTVASGDYRSVTDSSGKANIIVPKGTYTFTVVSDSYLDTSFSVTVVPGDAVEQTVTFQDCCSIDLLVTTTGTGRITLPMRDNFSGTPGALRVKWGDGEVTEGVSYHDYTAAGTYRVVFNYGESSNVLYWSSDFYANPLFKSSLFRVISWFAQKSTVVEKGAFKDCTALTTVQQWNTDNMRGTGEEMYMGCTLLTSYPKGNLKFATTCKRIFRESGMASTVNVGDIFDGCTCYDFTECFYGCNMIGVSGTFPATVSLMQSAFEVCPSLTNLDPLMFAGSTPSIVTGMFTGTRVESSVPVTMAPNGDASYCYKDCAYLNTLVQGTFASTGNVGLGHVCEGCTGLVTMTDTGIFNCSTTNFAYAFYQCSNLVRIDNLIPLLGVTTDASYAFSGIGITTIPFNTFSGKFGTDTVPVSFAHGFEACATLVYIGDNTPDSLDWTRSPFEGTNISDMSYCFRNCSLLKLNPIAFDSSDEVMGWDYKSTPIYTCSNWNYAFENCVIFGNGEQPSPSIRVDSQSYSMWLAHNLEGCKAPLAATGCFRNCTGLTDFGTIPTNWK